MKYELCYLVGESNEANLDRIKEEIVKIASNEGAVFAEPQIAEKRKLAYKIKKDIRGIYISQRFDLAEKDAESGYNPDAIAEMTKKLNLYQDILRFIFVQAEGLPPLMSKEERIAMRGDQRQPRERKAAPIREARREEKPVEAKKEDMKKEEKTEEEKGDIDKKLEEILNI